MRASAILYDVAWQAIDDAIVRGLRRASEPVPGDLVAGWCQVSHLISRSDLADALDRLVEGGRILRIALPARGPGIPAARGYLSTPGGG